MIEGVCKFYTETIALTLHEVTPEGGSTRIVPLGRINFIGGAGLATLFLIQKIAQSVFFLLVTAFTCFRHQNSTDSLLQNAKEIPTYLGAIALGHLGAIMPQTINERVLEIPSNGRLVPIRA